MTTSIKAKLQYETVGQTNLSTWLSELIKKKLSYIYGLTIVLEKLCYLQEPRVFRLFIHQCESKAS